MGSKAFLLLGLLFGIVLLISSDVAARDVAEASTNKEVDDVKQPNHYRGGYGGGGWGGGGSGGGGSGGGSWGGGGGGCNYGCCRRGYGRCIRCCSYANEAADDQTEDKPNN